MRLHEVHDEQSDEKHDENILMIHQKGHMGAPQGENILDTAESRSLAIHLSTRSRPGLVPLILDIQNRSSVEICLVIEVSVIL